MRHKNTPKTHTAPGPSDPTGSRPSRAPTALEIAGGRERPIDVALALGCHVRQDRQAALAAGTEPTGKEWRWSSTRSSVAKAGRAVTNSRKPPHGRRRSATA